MISEDRLSDRQREILDLAAQGLTDKDIAGRLGVAEGTLRTYWDRLRRRYGAKSRTEVTAKVLHRQMERALEDLNRLRATLDAVPHFVWTHFPDGAVEFCNAWFGRYAGDGAEEVHLTACEALMSDEDRRAFRVSWSVARQAGCPLDHSTRLRAQDGNLRWHRIRIVPIHDATGKVTQWLGTAHELFPQV